MDFDFKKNIVLENSRALLRPLEENDTDHLFMAASEDPKLTQYSNFQVYTRELLSNFIRESIQERRSGIRYPFVIFDKSTGSYAGSTSMASLSNRDKRFEIGWTWIGPGFQRTGLNRNCKFLLLQYAFDELQFERVELKTDQRNLQSRTAIEKIGGVYEGALRSHTLMLDGFRRTTVYYSILKTEWEKLKKDFLK